MLQTAMGKYAVPAVSLASPLASSATPGRQTAKSLPRFSLDDSKADSGGLAPAATVLQEAKPATPTNESVLVLLQGGRPQSLPTRMYH